jgi:putative sigma-54 modulation protein
MDEEEAVEQMALLGHEEFFVFLNAATKHINVLYRRRDGSYGLLEPEIA